MRNTHERTLAASTAEVGALLATAGQDGDLLWPGDRWPRMTLDGPVAVGARGGHGPIRYSVEGYEPGRSLTFRFDRAIGVDGIHRFDVEPGPVEGETVLRHVIEARPHGVMLVAWPVAIRWLHDAVLEDLLDRAEQAVTGTVASPAVWSPWVRFLRRVNARLPRRPTPTAAVDRP